MIFIHNTLLLKCRFGNYCDLMFPTCTFKPESLILSRHFSTRTLPILLPFKTFIFYYNKLKNIQLLLLCIIVTLPCGQNNILDCKIIMCNFLQILSKLYSLNYSSLQSVLCALLSLMWSGYPKLWLRSTFNSSI